MDATEAAIHKLTFIRSLVKRVVPEAEVMYPEDTSLPAKSAEIEREPKKNYRQITYTQQLNYAHDYVFIDERLEDLKREKQLLRAKFKELDKAIDTEIAELSAEKDRLRLGIRYLVIAENEKAEVAAIEASASLPTNLLVTSKKLTP